MKKDNKYIYEFEGNLYINLTNQCCNDCGFCLRNSGDGVKNNDTLWLEKEPSAEQVIDAIKHADFKYWEAVFCGYGESTYKMEELVAVAGYLKSTGKKTRLNTNGLGSAINGYNIVPQLKDRIDIVSISLNEADNIKYDKICRSVFGLDAYKYILDFAKECVANNIKTVLTVVDVISKEDIQTCAETAASIGAEFRVRRYVKDNVSYE